MEIRDRLTNEELSKKCKNQFELVNYAIRLAENIIKTGREPQPGNDAQNRAVQVLDEIRSGTDHLEEIPEVQVVTTVIVMQVPENAKRSQEREERHDDQNRKRKKAFSDVLPKPGAKRNRKILVE
jgi:hypothetical protein